MVVPLGQQYNVGEKPTAIMLYTDITSRHAGAPDKNKTKTKTIWVHNKIGL